MKTIRIFSVIGFTVLAGMGLTACNQGGESHQNNAVGKSDKALETIETEIKGYNMLQEKTDVQDTIIKMVNAIDTKKWQLAKDQFAKDVFVDYSSMNGQAGATMLSDDLVNGWEGLLEKVSTHHMLTNFEISVDGDKATSQSHVYASHLADGVEYWDIFGLYLHGLEKQGGEWKITSKTLVVHGQKGNTDFLADVSGQ